MLKKTFFSAWKFISNPDTWLKFAFLDFGEFSMYFVGIGVTFSSDTPLQVQWDKEIG